MKQNSFSKTANKEQHSRNIYNNNVFRDKTINMTLCLCMSLKNCVGRCGGSGHTLQEWVLHTLCTIGH